MGKSEQKMPDLTRILSQSLVGAYVIRNGTFDFVNERLAEIFGYDVEEIIDKKGPLDLTAPEDRDTVRSKIRQRKDGRIDSANYSFSGLTKAGARVPVRVHGTVGMFDGEQAIIGTLVRQEDEDRADRVLQDLAWGVANHTGDRFYQLLVVHLASCLNVEYAFIGEYDGEKVDLLAFYRESEIDNSVSVSAMSPPFEELLEGKYVSYSQGVLEIENTPEWFVDFDVESFLGTPLYDSEGQIIGIMGVLGRGPIKNVEFVEKTLQVFADRAGTEVDRSRTNRALRNSEAKHRFIFNAVSDAILVLDEDGKRILEANNAAEEIFGYSSDEFRQKTLGDLSAQTLRYDSNRFFKDRNIRKETGCKPFEWKWIDNKGTSFWGEVTLTREKFDEEQHILAVIRNVNFRVQTEHVFDKLHRLDPITDVLNRSSFYEELNRCIKEASDEHKVGILFLDIDGFKDVNKAYGHKMGDRILRTLSQKIQYRLGDKGILSRWGGDEFVVLMPHVIDVPQAESVGRELLEIFDSPIELAGETFHLSASLGIALYPKHGSEPGKLVTHADVAMFSAKEENGNTYEVYQEESTELARTQLRLENDLRDAIEHGQFDIHFQPQFDLQNGDLVGVEALVRWIHPDEGILYPKDFITLAESTGLILDIDKQVMLKAANAIRVWNEEMESSIGLGANVSPHNFMAGNVTKTIKEVLDESGLEPSRLTIEITETVAMKDIQYTLDVLNDLRDMGIQIAMDDFGTGYASLSNLTRLSMDILKIDRTLVNLIGTKKEEFEILKVLRPLAEELQLKTIAEGIETQDQLTLLREWGCDEGQGFLLSEPVPSLAIQELLDNGAKTVTEYFEPTDADSKVHS